MPSSLISARLRGIRSYNPDPKHYQTIEFMPLTLIVGPNGSGKTTIIESLKFIISGEEPPHSDSRRNFIHTPKEELKRYANNEEFYASVQIQFKNAYGEICFAKRDITRYGTTKTQPPTISSGYKVGQNSWVTVHRQDDWNKLIPKLFGLPNPALLSNVILCHQEDNLWCMGDSSNVKLIFDKIFGCEQYKKEIKNIDDETRSSKKSMEASEKEFIRFGEQVRRKKTIIEQIDRLKGEMKIISMEMENLNTKVSSLVKKKEEAASKVTASESRTQELRHLSIRIKSLVDKDSTLRYSIKTMTLKRPAPIVQRPRVVPKKPAPDPIVSDLDNVLGNFDKIVSMIDVLSKSADLNSLRLLIDETLVIVKKIKSKFVAAVDEPMPESPEPPPEDSSFDETFKEIERNRQAMEIQICDNMKELEELREQVAKLQKEADTDDDGKEAKNKYNEIEQQLIRVRDKRSHKSGSKNQMEREIKDLESELARFSKTNRDYAKSLGSMICHKIIIEDLEKLKKCFIESISTFHDQMILKINEVLRSRWRQIYQGDDIESIELVDEPITRGKDKKSYNYYMAMRKSGIRMKMREKSSAGQRALAAIILRMALAELFVRDFAFIALDEPTANLDLANVQSLAKSIGSYVRRRTKKGANIQWIIITHDEQFLRALDEEYSPFFYRVKMDERTGCSEINKVSCQEAANLDAGEVSGTAQ